jgi:hypothetical protein
VPFSQGEIDYEDQAELIKLQQAMDLRAMQPAAPQEYMYKPGESSPQA